MIKKNETGSQTKAIEIIWPIEWNSTTLNESSKSIKDNKLDKWERLSISTQDCKTQKKWAYTWGAWVT